MSFKKVCALKIGTTEYTMDNQSMIELGGALYVPASEQSDDPSVMPKSYILKIVPETKIITKVADVGTVLGEGGYDDVGGGNKLIKLSDKVGYLLNGHSLFRFDTTPTIPTCTAVVRVAGDNGVILGIPSIRTTMVATTVNSNEIVLFAAGLYSIPSSSPPNYVVAVNATTGRAAYLDYRIGIPGIAGTITALAVWDGRVWLLTGTGAVGTFVLTMGIGGLPTASDWRLISPNTLSTYSINGAGEGTPIANFGHPFGDDTLWMSAGANIYVPTDPQLMIEIRKNATVYVTTPYSIRTSSVGINHYSVLGSDNTQGASNVISINGATAYSILKQHGDYDFGLGSKVARLTKYAGSKEIEVVVIVDYRDVNEFNNIVKLNSDMYVIAGDCYGPNRTDGHNVSLFKFYPNGIPKLVMDTKSGVFEAGAEITIRGHGEFDPDDLSQYFKDVKIYKSGVFFKDLLSSYYRSTEDGLVWVLPPLVLEDDNTSFTFVGTVKNEELGTTNIQVYSEPFYIGIQHTYYVNINNSYTQVTGDGGKETPFNIFQMHDYIRGSVSEDDGGSVRRRCGYDYIERHSNVLFKITGSWTGAWAEDSQCPDNMFIGSGNPCVFDVRWDRECSFEFRGVTPKGDDGFFFIQSTYGLLNVGGDTDAIRSSIKTVVFSGMVFNARLGIETDTWYDVVVDGTNYKTHFAFKNCALIGRDIILAGTSSYSAWDAEYGTMTIEASTLSGVKIWMGYGDYDVVHPTTLTVNDTWFDAIGISGKNVVLFGGVKVVASGNAMMPLMADAAIEVWSDDITEYSPPKIESNTIKRLPVLTSMSDVRSFFGNPANVAYYKYGIESVGASRSIRELYGTVEDMYGNERAGVGVFAFYTPPIEDKGHIGAFYFGPEYTDTEIDYDVPTVTMDVVAFTSSTTVESYVVPTMVVTACDIAPIIENAFTFEFSGTPVSGGVPLRVKYDAYHYQPSNAMKPYWKPDRIRWWFDLENEPDVFEVQPVTDPDPLVMTTYHNYCTMGKFSVSACMDYKLIRKQ